MKFVKSNLDLLIAGLLVILAIGAYFWPLSPYKDELLKKGQERIGKANSTGQYLFTKQHPITIPGVGNIPDKDEPGNPTITYSKNLTDAAGEAQVQMKQQADKLIQEASLKNREKRVKVTETKGANKGEKIEHFIPLLSDGTVPEDNLLPTASTESWAFRKEFLRQWDMWNAKLGYAPYPANSKGLQDDIDRRIKEETETMQKNAMAAPTAAGQPAAANVQLPPEKRAEITKSVISKRADQLHCYVDDNAIPKPLWASDQTMVQPTPEQMFDALVCSWLTNDAVNAISKTNEGSHNVGTSPVKRVESITVGGNTTTGAPAAVLLAMNGASAMTPGLGAANMAAAGSGESARSMTGHVGDPNYDVSLMTIKIVIDPAYINHFIDELYRQNNGYTVLNIKTSMVDPLDAASNGYLYGEVQCVRVEIQVEDLLFRAWLDQIMPESYRRMLGRPMPTAATPFR